jgi:two-component system nitrogen regulation response regulator NtrX
MGDILIVDDERDIRELISEILIDEGYSTRIAGTSDEAMRQIKSQPPGLLILDIWLKDSDMDGIDILKKVKTDFPQMPVVIISGHGNIEIAVAAIKQGAYDFIEKPFNIDQLMVVIRRAMETSRLRRENSALKQQGGDGAQMLGQSAAQTVPLWWSIAPRLNPTGWKMSCLVVKMGQMLGLGYWNRPMEA